MRPNKRTIKILAALKKIIIQADYKTVFKKFVDQGNDEETVKQYLTEFKELRDTKDLGEFKDIDLWGKKSFEEFKEFVKKSKLEKSKTEEKRIEKTEGAELVHQNNDWSVYKIFTHKAARRYGAGTRWCITEEDGTRWREYTKDNVFYFLISKNRDQENPFYKIAVQVNKHNALKKTFWDANDDAWNASQVNEILLKVFKDNEEIDKVLVPFEMPKPDWLKELKENGMTNSVIDEIEETYGMTPLKYIPEHQFLAFEDYKNVGEYVKYSDIHDLQWAYKYMDGTEYIDPDIGGISTNEIGDVLEKLKSKYPKEYEDFISKLLKDSTLSEYLEDNEELKIKTIEEFNAANLRTSVVAHFISSEDDMDVWNIFAFSLNDASRSATESQLYKRIEKNLLECSALLVSTGKSTDGSKEYIMLDEPVYVGFYLADAGFVENYEEYRDEETKNLGIDKFDYEYPDTDEILTQLIEYHLPEYVGS